MYELLFLSGARAGVVIPVGGTVVAGRDTECDLEVPDPRVSRTHARIEWDGVTCRVSDMHSSNGTFVNEQAVEQAELSPGDVVRLGSTRLRLQRRGGGVAPRERVGAGTSVFGLRDENEPETAYSVSMRRADTDAAKVSRDADDVAVLRARIAAMERVAEMLASRRTLDELYEPVLETLFELLPQTHRGFLLLGDAAEALTPCAMRQRGEGASDSLVVSRSICRAALQKRAALVYREGGDEAIDPGRSVIDLQIRSALAVPLMVGEEVLGVVVVDTRDASRGYDQDDVELAVAIGHQIAVALKNAQLVAEVEAQTATRNNLMRFLPEAMADQVLKGEVDGGLGGREYHGTVLFSDLIGFTARAEQMEPEQLVAFMNRYFNKLVPAIEHQSGSIDKFMGDAIMAVWGIPGDRGDAARRAVAAALQMQTNLAVLNSEEEPPFWMGIGIATGPMVAGNIGAHTRREYTVLGDTVNTAQRIGAVACREQVLIGVETWERLDGAGFGVGMPPLSLRNKAAPVDTYSVRGIAVEDGEIQLWLPVRVGKGRGYLIRRLADESFILLHDQGPVTGLRLRAVELAPEDLEMSAPAVTLPSEKDDGRLQRSLVRLEDPTLGGLLSGTRSSCHESWERMNRSDTALA